MLGSISVSDDGPINTITPNKPITTPAIFAGVMRSSVNKAPAISTVNKGVVALIIEAKPDVI